MSTLPLPAQTLAWLNHAADAGQRGEGPRLQWTDNMPPSEACRYDHCIAETPFGRFLITWKGWKEYDSPTVDETPWGDWYAAFNSVDDAKAACQQGMNERLTRCGTPATPPASDDMPPGPFTEDDLRRAWNQQSDDLNQWDSLGSDEQLAWAQVQAIDADRAALKIEPEGESPRPDGDWFIVALLAQDMRSRGLAEQVAGDELLKLANNKRSQFGNHATPPAPAAPVDDGPVAVALIEAESALADVAEGEAVSPRADGCLHWAEARCTEALAAIRPVMRRHGIRTSDLAPAPTPPPADPADGLVERVANAMGPSTQAAMDTGELPFGNAYAASREVADWLDTQGHQSGANAVRCELCR